MKRFFAFLLAICTMLSCVGLFSACDNSQNPPENNFTGEVTKEQWNLAFITEKFNNEVLSNDISSYIISESLTVKKNEKVIININSREKLNDEDRKYIEKLIKNNYMKMYSEKIYK